MLDGGWPEEVTVLTQSVSADVPAWQATGYRHVRRLVTGQCTREEARERIVIQTRQYAKRQRTWFRRDPRIAWLDAEDAPGDDPALVKAAVRATDEGPGFDPEEPFEPRLI